MSRSIPLDDGDITELNESLQKTGKVSHASRSYSWHSENCGSLE